MHSLRVRLLAWLLVPLALYVGVSAAIAWRSDTLIAQVVQDRQLLASARIMAGQVEWIDGILQLDVPPAALEIFAPPGPSAGEPVEAPAPADRIYYQVRARDGRLLAGVPDFPDGLPPGPSGEPIYQDARYRGAALRIVRLGRSMYDSGGAQEVTVAVGQTQYQRRSLLHSLFRPMLVDMLALLAMAALLAIGALTVELRPIVRLRDEVAGRDPAQLAPIRAGELHTELRPVVDAINQCIQRLHAQSAGQKRFIAAAAHQLRTPLMLLDTQLQYATREPAGRVSAETLQALRDTCRGMAELTNKLLLMAQAEAAQGSAVERHDVDLVQLAARVLEELVPLAQRKGMDLGMETAVPSATVEGNPGLLHAMIGNLVDNAIRYGNQGGRITVAVDGGAGRVRLRVIDDGPGVPAEARERVFERFYRLGGETGSGLGLSIVKEVVAGLHGEVAIEAGPDGVGACVVVWLPTAGAPRVSSSTAA
jgi:two-component system sensor histidine kinase TctE